MTSLSISDVYKYYYQNLRTGWQSCLARYIKSHPKISLPKNYKPRTRHTESTAWQFAIIMQNHNVTLKLKFVASSSTAQFVRKEGKFLIHSPNFFSCAISYEVELDLFIHLHRILFVTRKLYVMEWQLTIFTWNYII